MSPRQLVPYETGIVGVFTLLALVFTVVYRAERRRYFLLWGFASGLMAAHDAIWFLHRLVTLPPAIAIAARLFLLAAAVCLVCGLYDFLQLRARRCWLLVALAPALVVLAGAVWTPLRRTADVAVFACVGLALVVCGVRLLRMAVPGAGRLLAGLGFIPFGAWAASFPFLREHAWFPQVEAEVTLLFVVTVSIGALLMHFEIAREETRRLAERNRRLLEEATESAAREREMRQRLAQGERMEALGRLAGGVAHDFNNILTSILGGTELAMASLDARDARTRRNLEQVCAAATRAAGITRQLLEFGRGRPVELRPVDLNQAVVTALGMLRPLLGERVNVEDRLHPSAVWVKANPAQLDQLIMNLTVNARDAMPNGGTILIETDVVTTAGPGGVRLTVSDHGVGIRPDILPRIFEPFFTTKTGQGTGLGLATVYGIVRELGGDVEVSSLEGKGTTFVVTLPRHQPAEAEVVTRTAPALGDERRRRVVVVDDDPSVLQVVGRALRDAGHTVVAFGSAEEALAGAALQPGDLLLTDVRLPGLDGPSLARELRSRVGDLAVVFMSGHTQQKLDLAGWPDAAFVPKPFRLESLLSTVARAQTPEATSAR